jgi:hypothetical protein
MNNDRNIKVSIMRSWGIMIPAAFFSTVTDTIHLFVLAIAVSIMVLIRKKTIVLTLRSGIYGAVLALTVIVLANAIFKIENRFFMTPSEVAVPTSLIFAMTFLFYDDRPSFTASILIMCVFAMMMCGDINNSNTFNFLPLPSSMGKLENIQSMYLISLFLCCIPFFFMMNRSHYHLKIIKEGKTKLLILKAVLVISSLALVFLIYSPTKKLIVPLSKTLESQVNRLISSFRKNQQRTAFENNVNLRDSYFDQANDLDVILIRVDADSPPGYMRSRVYENYFDGSWNSSYKPNTMQLLVETHEYSHNTFSFLGMEQLDRKDLDRIDVYYSGNLKVKNMLHMGKSRYVEMTCEALMQTSSGTITGKEVDFSGGITLFNEKSWTQNDPFPAPEMTPAMQQAYLQIDEEGPESLKVQLLEAFSEIHLDTSTPDKLAKSITKYFSTYEYKLGVKLAGSLGDPIFDFLKKEKGHCELFATSTVMLLRAHGVPARYVTGFFCSEEHPSGNYFIGRSGDLHAWVEYYDKDSSSWKLLEPTPPGSMPDSKSHFNFISSTWDSISNRWQQLVSNVVRGYFAESILLFLKSILDILMWCFSSPLRAFVSSCLLIWFFARKKRSKPQMKLSKEFLLLKKELDKMLHKVSKLKDLEISQSMTISEIAGILDKRNNSESKVYASCLREYEALRYNEKQRNDQSIKAVITKMHSCLKAGIR